MTTGVVKHRLKTLDMAYIAVCAVLIAVCSWIIIPATVPFTMQTFAVFTVVGLLGGKRGTICILLYILLGAIGLPVFSGFSGGMGVLLGTTGGYIMGFLGSTLLMWGVEKIFGKKLVVQIISMVAGLFVCYALGTAWFMAAYSYNNGSVGLTAVLGWCVIPFIIPDIIKIVLAVIVTKRVGKHIQ